MFQELWLETESLVSISAQFQNAVFVSMFEQTPGLVVPKPLYHSGGSQTKLLR